MRWLVQIACAALLFGLFGKLEGSRVSQDRVLLGTGAHTYEWIKDWAKLPEGMRFGNTHGCIVTDSEGRVYVNTDRHGVIIFSPDGEYVNSFGKDFRNGAHGMAIAKEGDKEYLYLAHTSRHEALKMSLEGETIMILPFPEKSGAYQDKKEYLPTSVAVGPNGDIYVSDGYGKSWVHQYNAKGEWIRSWGGKGKEPGKFDCPHGIYIDNRGETPVLLVADRENNRLQTFTLDGKPLGVVEGMLRRPCHAHQMGKDLVIPDLAGRVTILDKDNKVICHIGENADQKKWAQNGIPKKDWADGQFISPHCAHWDAEGNLYVMDWLQSGRITKLKRVKDAPPKKEDRDY
jgi:hypothetical protein